MAQATIAALSNNAAKILSSKDEAVVKPTLQQTALGELHTSNDNNNVDESSSSSVRPSFERLALEALTARFSADSRDRQSHSAMFLRCRFTSEPLSSLHTLTNLGNRVDYFFTERQPGIVVSVKELVTMKVIYWVNMSPSMADLLSDTHFLNDASGILEDIFLGKWKIVGFLASSSASACKACVTQFLKSNESASNSQDILRATVRILQLLGHLLGPVTYRPWQSAFEDTLPTFVQVRQIHPKSLIELVNNQIQSFFSTQATNDIRSLLERGGDLATYIREQLRMTVIMSEALQASSLRYLTSAILESQAKPLVAPFVPNGNNPKPKNNGKGLAHTPKVPRPMANLKGFCLEWLQSDVMPCTSQKCKLNLQTNAPTARHLRHRHEFDLLPAAQRSVIVAEAKKLTTSGVVKVVA